MAWPRWLGVSVAIHAAAITGVWISSQATRHAPSAEPIASVMAVSLVEFPDADAPVPGTDPPAPPLIAPEPLQSRPTPSPSPSPEGVPLDLAPTEEVPETDPALLRPLQLIEEPLPVIPAQAETTPDALANVAPGHPHAAPTAAQEQYRPLVLAVLERAKRYPLVARRRGWEGTVEIAFRISPDGEISDAHVIAPSAHRVLDEATLAMVHRITSLPAPPDRTPLRFPVRIEYKLDSIVSPISTEGAHP